jgi:glycerophosphoryl diester phosphodiesterase
MNKRTLFLLFLLSSVISCKPRPMQNSTQLDFDWQGHRGARGIMPENTIPAFLKALEFPEVKTLELDVAVSADGKLIVSHEPWFSSEITTKPNGTPVQSEEAKNLKLFNLSYENIKTYDTGLRGNKRFPEQQRQRVHKPSLSDLVLAVREACTRTKRTFPQFNIEIKSMPEWDGIFTPPIAQFCQIVVDEITALGIENNCFVQSFDPRGLEVVHKLNPKLKTCLLVENLNGVEANLSQLSYKPDVYSPYYNLLRKKDVALCHKMGLKVVPWTVNNPDDMRRLMRYGVDGIITDYPNRIQEALNFRN